MSPRQFTEASSSLAWRRYGFFSDSTHLLSQVLPSGRRHTSVRTGLDLQIVHIISQSSRRSLGVSHGCGAVSRRRLVRVRAVWLSVVYEERSHHGRPPVATRDRDEPESHEFVHAIEHPVIGMIDSQSIPRCVNTGGSIQPRPGLRPRVGDASRVFGLKGRFIQPWPNARVAVGAAFGPVRAVQP